MCNTLFVSHACAPRRVGVYYTMFVTSTACIFRTKDRSIAILAVVTEQNILVTATKVPPSLMFTLTAKHFHVILINIFTIV